VTERSAAIASLPGLTTAADALRDEELERTRGFLKIGWGIAAVAVLAVLRLPGNRELAHALIAAIAVTTLPSVVVYRVPGTPGPFHAPPLGTPPEPPFQAPREHLPRSGQIPETKRKRGNHLKHRAF